MNVKIRLRIRFLLTRAAVFLAARVGCSVIPTVEYRMARAAVRDYVRWAFMSGSLNDGNTRRAREIVKRSARKIESFFPEEE